MSFPVRCFTCGKVIGRHEKSYNVMLGEGMSKKEALDALNMTRYCCRRMFLGHVDMTDNLLLYPDPVVNDSEQKKKTEE